MPRTASLKPVMIQGRNRPWMLSVPPDLSETGKRQQLFYTSQREAETVSEQLKTRKRNFGHSLAVMSPARMHEAAQAFSLLDASSCASSLSLVSAIRESIERHEKRLKSVSLEALFDSYLAAKGHTSQGRFNSPVNSPV